MAQDLTIGMLPTVCIEPYENMNDIRIVVLYPSADRCMERRINLKSLENRDRSDNQRLPGSAAMAEPIPEGIRRNDDIDDRRTMCTSVLRSRAEDREHRANEGPPAKPTNATGDHTSVRDVHASVGLRP